MSSSPLRFMPSSPLRRRVVVAAALACTGIGSGRAQRQLVPTPSQTEGPFYPRALPNERDADLTRVAGHAERARGTPLYFAGRVLDRDGRPLSGTHIELWQCDAAGRYHHVGDPGPLDEGFQGYGTTTSGADGRYAFVTIRPVAYPGRPPHLHFKLQHPNAQPLTTQLYVTGDETAGDSVLAGSPRGTRERLSVVVAPAPDREVGALGAAFDFVLATR